MEYWGEDEEGIPTGPPVQVPLGEEETATNTTEDHS
jgi:hypothetical protein